MTNWFDSLYSKIRDENLLLTRIRFYSLERFLVRCLANIILPIYFKLTNDNKFYRLIPTDSRAESRIIVSLTSFPARIKRLWLVIETILRQTQKPDLIILWLSKEQFPVLDSVPHSLLKLQKRGLIIRLEEGDLRSHKKYYYTFREYPNDIIITIDDDIFYPSYMIKEMVNESLRFHEERIICRYALAVNRTQNKELMSYSYWGMEKDLWVNYLDVFFGSGGGTLFPPNTLWKDLLNKDLFLRLTPIADDVWLNAMCRLAGARVHSVNRFCVSILPIVNKHDFTLADTNIGDNMNDEQIRHIREYYIQKHNIDPFKIKNNVI